MTEKLASEQVVVSAPMSFSGSAARVWKITDQNGIARWIMIMLALGLIFFIWFVVLFWYCIFRLLLVPYRLIRRGSRKRKVENLRHRELLEATQKKS